MITKIIYIDRDVKQLLDLKAGETFKYNGEDYLVYLQETGAGKVRKYLSLQSWTARDYWENPNPHVQVTSSEIRIKGN